MPEPTDGSPRPLGRTLLSGMRRDRARRARRTDTAVLLVVVLATVSVGYLLAQGPRLAAVGPVAVRVSAGLFAGAVLAGLAHLVLSRRLGALRSAALWAVQLEEVLDRKGVDDRHRLPEEADEEELRKRLRDDFELDLDELPLRRDPDDLRALYGELAQQEVQTERDRVRRLAAAFTEGLAGDLESPLASPGDDGPVRQRRRTLARWRRRCYRAAVGLYAGGVVGLAGAYLWMG